MRGFCQADEYDCSARLCGSPSRRLFLKPYLERHSKIQEINNFPQHHKMKHAVHFWKSQNHLGHDSLQPNLGPEYQNQARRHYGPRFHHLLEHHQEPCKHRRFDNNRKEQDTSFPGFLKRVIRRQNQLRQKKELNPENTILYEPKSKVQVARDEKMFKINLDTSHYQPDEIKVKIVKDKIDISAVHESIDQDLYEFHEMYRSFSLPEDVDSTTVVSHIDSNGKLTVEAPLQHQEETTSERDVPIIRLNN